MTKRCLGAGLSVLGALLIAGCAQTAGTGITIDTVNGKAVVREDSYRMKGRVKVEKATYSETDGVRHATVTIKSMLKRRQRLQARMIWLDEEGAAIDADGKPFRAYVLDGMDSMTVTGYAPSARGVTARVQVREDGTAE